MRTDASARLQFSYLSVSYTIIPRLMRFSFKRFIYIIIAGLLLFGSGEAFTIDARKSSKARTSQTSKKRSSSSKKKSTSTKSKKKKKSSRNRKSSKRRTSRKKTTRRYSRPAPPPDPVMNDSLTLAINDALLKWLPENLNPGGLRVNAVKTDSLQRLTSEPQ